MHEALVVLLNYGFSELNLNRVEADIDPRNINSARSLERIGFTKEGHLRESCVVSRVLTDSALYGLLQREWKAVGAERARCTSYLAVPSGDGFRSSSSERVRPEAAITKSCRLAVNLASYL
jgi:Acetyltransferase (GNAT) domain